MISAPERLDLGDDLRRRRRGGGGDDQWPRQRLLRRLGMIDKGDQDRRRGAEVGHASLANQVPDHGRVELAQADVGAADRGHRPG